MREELRELLEEHENGLSPNRTRNELECILEEKGFDFNKKDLTYTNSDNECYAWMNDEPVYFKAKDEKTLKKLRKVFDQSEDVNYLPLRLGLGLCAATGLSALGVGLLHNYAPEIYHTMHGSTPETTQMLYTILGGGFVTMLGTILPIKYHLPLQEKYLQARFFTKLSESETRYVLGYKDILREMIENES